MSWIQLPPYLLKKPHTLVVNILQSQLLQQKKRCRNDHPHKSVLRVNSCKLCKADTQFKLFSNKVQSHPTHTCLRVNSRLPVDSAISTNPCIHAAVSHQALNNQAMYLHVWTSSKGWRLTWRICLVRLVVLHAPFVIVLFLLTLFAPQCSVILQSFSRL